MILRHFFQQGLLAFFAFLVFAVFSPSTFAITGDGSPETPYQLSTCADLLLLDGTIYDEALNYELAGDIDCTGENEVFPLFNGEDFTGVFSGNDFTISGLAESHTAPNIAMFVRIDGATLESFTLDGIIMSTQNNVAGLVVTDNGNSTISNVTLTMDIIGGAYIVAGVVGETTDTLTRSIYTNVDFTGTVTTIAAGSPAQNIGGFVGYTRTADFVNCDVNVLFNIGEHENILDLGGFAGSLNSSTISNSSVTMNLAVDHNISFFTNIGGMVGYSTDSSIEYSDVNAVIEAGTALLPIDNISNLGGFYALTEESSSSLGNTAVVDITLHANSIQMLGGYAGFLCSAEDEIDCATEEHSASTIEGTMDIHATNSIYNLGGYAGLASFTHVEDISVELDIDIDSHELGMGGGLIGYLNNGALVLGEYIGTMTILVDNDTTSRMYNIGALAGLAELDRFAAEPYLNVESNTASGVLVIGDGTTRVPNLEFIGGGIGYGSGGTYYENGVEMIVVLYGNDVVNNIGGFVGGIDTDDNHVSIQENYFYGELILSDHETISPQFIGGFAGTISKSFGDAELTLTNNFSSGILFAPSNMGAFAGNIDGFTIANISALYTDMSIYSFDRSNMSGFIFSLSDVPDIQNSFTAAKFDYGEEVFLENTGAVAVYNDTTDFTNVFYNKDSLGGENCVPMADDVDFSSCIAYNVDGSEDDLLVNNTTADPFTDWNFDTVWETYADSHPMLRVHGNIYDRALEDPDNLGFDFSEGILTNMEDPLDFSFTLEDFNRFKNLDYTISFYPDDFDSDPVMEYTVSNVIPGEYSYTFGDTDGTYTLSTPATLPDGEYYVGLSMSDSYENESDLIPFEDEGGSYLFYLDRTDPALTEVTPIDAALTSNEATYTFSMVEESSAELHVEACGPTVTAEILTTLAPVGITFSDLVSGETYECDVYVVDEAGNISNTLVAGPFTYTEARRSSGGGGGGKARTSDSRTSSTSSETTFLENTPDPSYEEEIQEATILFTKEPTKESNKCEALTMMARALEWPLESVTEAAFSDIPEWCYSVADYAKKHGYVQGRSENLLGLDTPMSRYEFATILGRIVEEEIKRQLAPLNPTIGISDKPSPFTDELVEWSKKYVLVSRSFEIVQGFEDGSFGGEKSIIKQDLAIILMRWLKLLNA